MKTYTGIRLPNQCIVKVSEEDSEYHLDWRLDIQDRSPTGIEWGYGGSGPSQLAIALIADATGDDSLAEEPHITFWFKWNVVSTLPRMTGKMVEWELTQKEIKDYIRSEPWQQNQNTHAY